MAPPKLIDTNVLTNKNPTLVKPQVGVKMVTRNAGRTSASSMLKKMNIKDKRKADQLSPPKGKTTKRSAFFDITNATTNNTVTNSALGKKNVPVVAKKATAKITTIAIPKQATITRISKTIKSNVGNEENVDPLAKSKQSAPIKKSITKDVPEIKVKVVDINVKKSVAVKEPRPKPKEETSNLQIKQVAVKTTAILAKKEETRSSDEDSSLYATALETISAEESILIITPIKKEIKISARTPAPPPGVVDFDKENWDDPYQVSVYAMDVFKYYKTRETDFKIKDYMPKQTMINAWMRSLLVDWMVDVQEHFELNHETLYLAVKMLDLYLSKKNVPKESLQLIGAGCLFIASKYDERIPPAIEDFLHVCEGYTREDLITMEIELFKQMDYCLGMPLSYRFLRRFARCCKTSMPVLTLARFVLELSLMEYPMVFESESKLAAACLYLALRMKDIGGWSATLEYYSGYKLQDFKAVAILLNAMLHRKPKEQLRTVRTKYSHTIFFEVAKIPLIGDESL